MESSVQAVFPASAVSDGLGVYERWRRAREDEAMTLGVIVQRLADGETLKAICRSSGWPHGKVLEWLADDEGRCGRYRRAKALGAESEVDRAQEVADGSGEPKLIVDTIFKRAEAHAQEVYGRRMKVERQVSVTADEVLVGTMGALLAGVRAARTVQIDLHVAQPEKVVAGEQIPAGQHEMI